jgi:hypothetical protein
MYNNSVCTSQETAYYVSITKTNRLMLFRERVAVYCANHAEHTNTLCGQNTEFLIHTYIHYITFHGSKVSQMKQVIHI